MDYNIIYLQVWDDIVIFPLQSINTPATLSLSNHARKQFKMLDEAEDVPLFALPVDADHRATILKPFSVTGPHMLSFHLAWLSLFTCYFSAFAAPPLLPVIRDSLSLTASSAAASAISGAAGTIIGRLSMGPACDLLGPRIASAASTLLSAPAIFLLSATATCPISFSLLRFLSGFSLASFVSNQ